jgi:uncharacterized membrane protein
MRIIKDDHRVAVRVFAAAVLLVFLTLLPFHAAAAFGGGHFEDTLADILVWVVLVVAPIVGIGVFLLIHILPEKIAEKREHPQLDAIKIMCLLSLVFGGMLWPIAWIWAYTKPVLHKMAYGTDGSELEAEKSPAKAAPSSGPAKA